MGKIPSRSTVQNDGCQPWLQIHVPVNVLSLGYWSCAPVMIFQQKRERSYVPKDKGRGSFKGKYWVPLGRYPSSSPNMTPYWPIQTYWNPYIPTFPFESCEFPANLTTPPLKNQHLDLTQNTDMGFGDPTRSSYRSYTSVKPPSCWKGTSCHFVRCLPKC